MFKLGLKAKLALPVLIIGASVIGVLLFVSLTTLHDELIDAFEQKGRTLAASLSASVQDTILNRDASTIQGFIDQYREMKGVAYIFIVNERGEVIAHTFSPSVPNEMLELAKKRANAEDLEISSVVTKESQREVLAISSPILAGLLGQVHIGMDVQSVEDDVVFPILVQGSLIAGAALLMVLGFLLLIFAKFLNPVLQITKTSKRIVASKDLNARISYAADDEIGELVEVFNTLIEELKSYTESLEEKVAIRTKDLEASKLEQEELYKKLLETARFAGMAEVATNVLHNVGNILNSVNISTQVFQKKLVELDTSRLKKLSSLLENHKDDLGGFFSTDVKAQKIPQYLKMLVDHYDTVIGDSKEEVKSVSSKIEHIRHIVSTQQNYAKSTKVIEKVDILMLVKQAINIHQESLGKHQVELNLSERGNLTAELDRHEILQVFVNIISNAKNAVIESENSGVIEIALSGESDFVSVSVADNGVGIDGGHLEKIFEHGFTTRKDGHGFGLHSCANTIKEMGGQLNVSSEGLGRGAKFTIMVPRKVSNRGQEVA